MVQWTVTEDLDEGISSVSNGLLTLLVLYSDDCFRIVPVHMQVPWELVGVSPGTRGIPNTY